MKTAKFLFIAAVAMLMAVFAFSAALAAPATLTGHWTAPDHDGDTVHMILSGGQDGVYNLHAFDIHAPGACIATGGLGLLEGTATFDANTNLITKTVVASCPSEGLTYPQNTLVMYYDPATDTIYDPTFDLLYSR